MIAKSVDAAMTQRGIARLAIREDLWQQRQHGASSFIEFAHITIMSPAPFSAAGPVTCTFASTPE